jgi:hypothetical protein
MINNFIILSLMSNTFDHTSQPTGNFVYVGSLAALLASSFAAAKQLVSSPILIQINSGWSNIRSNLEVIKNLQGLVLLGLGDL